MQKSDPDEVRSQDGRSVRERVVEALRTARVPTGAPAHVWGGLSCGKPCALCGDRIESGKAEYELEFAAGAGATAQSLTVHVSCFSIWEEERHEVEAERSDDANRLSHSAVKTNFLDHERKTAGGRAPS